MGAEFVRGRVCQGPSLLGAEMSRNRLQLQQTTNFVIFFLIFEKIRHDIS